MQILGKLNIRRDGIPLSPFKSRKVAALLVYLALNPGPQTRSHLAGLLWSDLPEEKALSNLRFALWNIHEVLGIRVFNADRVSVEWQPTPELQLDVEGFLKALWQARSKGPETPETIHALEDALHIYQGDLLAEFDLADDLLFNEWLQQQRAYLRQVAIEAFYRLATYRLEHRQLSAAVVVARRLLELEPWHEETHRLLMLALTRSGQRSAALAQYAACQRVLRDELGTSPSLQTVQLYERIRAAGSGPRHNLPLALTPFVGRRAELEELLGLLDNPNCRLLTLVGPGGVGKTRLAQQAAAVRSDHFLNGIAWIDLEAEDSPERLLPTVAEQLGIEWRQDKLTEQLGYFLREKEMLLVLDNVERLRAGAGGLAELLRATPDVKILATSRERLNLQCEWVFPVSGLNFPQTEDDIAAFDAVQLFIQTARRADLHFDLTPSNIPAIRHICRLVQGLPLALELAAALLPETSPDQVARSVENSLRVLVTKAPDVHARHRSLYAVLLSAWNVLSDAEQIALYRLAIFRGGFLTEAAQQVARVAPLHLSALADKSWLRRTQAGRYEMLEMVRQFLIEEGHADPDDQVRVRQAHARYFADLLTGRQTALRFGRPAALAEIDAEIDNIRTAWRWAVQNRAVDLLARAADGLGAFLEMHSRSQEGADAFGLAHDLAIQTGGTDGARLLAWEGMFVFRLADYPRAQTLLETGLSMLRGEHASDLEAFVLNHLGLVAERTGQREQARTCFEASIRHAQTAGDDWAQARAMNNLGYLYYLDGNYGQARTWLEQALARRRSLDDRFGIAKTLINLAQLWQASGESEQVETAYRESLAIFRELDNRLGIAVCLNNLGFHAFRQRRYAEARQVYEEALGIRREIGDLWGIALGLDNLGAVACELEDYTAAWAYYVEALILARSIGANRRILEILVGLARLAEREGDLTQAVEWLVCVLNHPELSNETRERGEKIWAELKTRLPQAQFDAAVEHGQTMSWETVMDQILAKPFVRIGQVTFPQVQRSRN